MVKNDLPVGAAVYADPLIVKVFYNLAENAARFGEKITTIRFSGEERGETISSSVKMTASAFLPVLKKKYSSGDSGRTPGLVSSSHGRFSISPASSSARPLNRARAHALR
jgi:signal transduction histidine kinase